MKLLGNKSLLPLFSFFGGCAASLALLWLLSNSVDLVGIPSEKQGQDVERNEKKTGQHERRHSHSFHKAGLAHKKERTPSPNFNYKKERARVTSLVLDMPNSSKELMAFVLSGDSFKKEKQVVHPHSQDEWAQNQQGALKVLALRALVEKAKSPQTLSKHLNQIIRQAQDPTIVQIAQAVKDSHGKGRSFFNDFVEGVARMEL